MYEEIKLNTNYFHQPEVNDEYLGSCQLCLLEEFVTLFSIDKIARATEEGAQKKYLAKDRR